MFSTLTTGFGRACDRARLRVNRRITGLGTGRRPSLHLRAGRTGGAAKGLLAAALILVSGAAYSHSWYPHN
ncbi:MAG: hypothetical protein WA858_27690, partial [Xanthobacteraceae bacterium]